MVASTMAASSGACGGGPGQAREQPVGEGGPSDRVTRGVWHAGPDATRAPGPAGSG